MITDFIDPLGRRYTEVDVFPDGPLKASFADSAFRDECVECGIAIRHAYDRYWQRNDATDGLEPGLAGLLMGLTYDAVCAGCGDRLVMA